MPKKHSATTQAFLDLNSAQTELRIRALQGDAIKPEDANKLSAQIDGATNVLQRTILRAARVLEQGASDDGEGS